MSTKLANSFQNWPLHFQRPFSLEFRYQRSKRTRDSSLPSLFLEEEAPGAFKRPHSAYKLARNDLKSSHWQTEIEGLAAIVRLIKYHPDIILEDLNEVVKDLNHECKNLRSQVRKKFFFPLIYQLSQL